MNRKIAFILLFSAIIRALFAWSIELGNDEVYYRIFALFPDWSYFDHPPLVAWLIRLTTFGAPVVDELFVRLGSVIIGTANTYIIYRIVRRLTDSERGGLIAALLYSGSIYCSIIVGTFIMPDTPLALFWLLSISLLLQILPPSKSVDHKMMLLAGLFIGLAMLSKYTGAYLWGATALYILLFNRKLLKTWSLWVAVLISFVVFSPVIVWNIQNDFITFTFHGARVTAENSINWLYFGRELMGSIFYNNPINWIVALIAIFAWRKCRFISTEKYRFLLTFSLPMIFLFLGISLTRETLPHWAAPAYFALIILASAYLNTLNIKGVRTAILSVGLTIIVGVAGVLQITYGFANLGDDSDAFRLGRKDFTLDTYGWRQGGEKFAVLRDADTIMSRDADIIQYGWDDAAHIDCYFALPLGMKTKTIGDIKSTHYWEWINIERGGFEKGDSVYLITSSRYALDPQEIYGSRFDTIMPADTIKIYRCDRHVYNFYVYRLLGLKY